MARQHRHSRPYRDRDDHHDSPQSNYSRGSAHGSDRSGRHPSHFRFGDHHDSDSRTDFSFRHGEPPHGRFSDRRDGPPPQPRRSGRDRDRDRYRPGGDSRRDDRRMRARNAYRNRPRPLVSASDRPLVSTTARGSTPDRLEGMESGFVKFRDVDEMTESESEPESEAGAEDAEAGYEPGLLAEDGAEEEDEDGRPRKRARVGQATTPPPARPLWSNPDPYTILPPEEERGKRKDVVKMIRKAKIQVEKPAEPVNNAVTDNNDFISFDFGDDFEPQASAADDNDDTNEQNDADGDDTEAHYVVDDSEDNALVSNDVPPSATSDDRIWTGKSDPEVVTIDDSSDEGSAPAPQTALTNGSSTTTAAQTPKQDRAGASQGPQSESYSIPPPPMTPPSPIPLPPHSPRRSTSSVLGKRPKPGSPDGTVLPDWLPQPGRDDAPWCTVDHSYTAETSDWLNMEICDFYEFMKPKDFEHEIRADLFKRIETVLVDTHPDGKAYCFGSYASGLFLPLSDMDIVFVSDQFMRSGIAKFASRQAWMHRLVARLRNRGITSDASTQVIFHARVPIIKFVDRQTGIHVDISFEQYNGVTAIETFNDWKREYPALPVLVYIIKQFLLMRGLNEVYCGGIGGFTTICLVVSLLQLHPGVASGTVSHSENLGELLMDFFDLYGNKFNRVRTGIRLNPPGYFSKATWQFRGANKDMSRMTIIDPNNEENDISSGSSKIELVQETFREAYQKLQARMAELATLPISERRKARSILSAIVGGNYSEVEQQRAKLRGLTEHVPAPGVPRGGEPSGGNRPYQSRGPRRDYQRDHGGGGGSDRYHREDPYEDRVRHFTASSPRRSRRIAGYSGGAGPGGRRGPPAPGGYDRDSWRR